MNDLLIKKLEQFNVAAPTPGSRVVNGDALEVLRALPTGAIDCVATDPPFFLSNGGTTNSGGRRVSVDKGDWDASSGLRDDFQFHRQWLRLVQRVLKPEGTAWVFGTQHNLYAIGWAMKLADWNILNHVTWEKPNPPPNLGCRQLTHSTEGIIWAAPARYSPLRHVFNYDEARADNDGKQLKDVWRMAAPGADEKEHGRHSTQKPVEIMRRIVELSTNPGQVVLDPFTGSGTTGVAAVGLGRHFVGVEFTAAYHALACARISAISPG